MINRFAKRLPTKVFLPVEREKLFRESGVIESER